MPRKTDTGGVGAAAQRCRFNEAAARCRGKRLHDGIAISSALASMRPRPDAAENVRGLRLDRPRGDASMRPRPDAAENTWTATQTGRLGLLQ